MSESTGTLGVLIVDDHRMLRESLRLALEREDGIEVVGEAGDGVSAVRLALELEPDVVLMDVDMPGLNGIDACQEIRDARPDAKVLFLSASAERQSVTAALVAGAKGYVVKVAGHDDLVRAIRAVGRGESILDPTVTQGIASELARLVTQEKRRDVEQLTPREQEVLLLVSGGATNREVASDLVISEYTAKNVVSNLLGKLGLRNRSELVRWAYEHDLTSQG